MSSLIKHSRMDDAQEYMEEAGQNLRRFEKELQDVSLSDAFSRNSSMDISSFLRFADSFFDNMFLDFTFSHRLIRPVTRWRTPSGRWRTSWTDSAPCHNIFHFTAGQVRPAVCAGASQTALAA